LRGACETEPLAEANRGCVKRAAPVRWHNTPPFLRLLPLPTGACRLETSTEGSGWHGQVARITGLPAGSNPPAENGRGTQTIPRLDKGSA